MFNVGNYKFCFLYYKQLILNLYLRIVPKTL